MSDWREYDALYWGSDVGESHGEDEEGDSDLLGLDESDDEGGMYAGLGAADWEADSDDEEGSDDDW